MGKRTALHNVIVLVTALLTAQSIKLHCATMLIFGYMSGSMLRSMPVFVSRKVQRLPSGQRMDPGDVVASYVPDKSLGPPLGEKSTIKRSLLLLSLTTCPVNVHGVRPCRRRKRCVLVTDEAVPPAASTPLARCVPLMAN